MRTHELFVLKDTVPYCTSFDSFLSAQSSPDVSLFCLHTRSRREKIVGKECRDQGIPHFLPLRQSIKQYRGRRYLFDVPMFTGYLFCAATWEKRYELFMTNNLVQAIEIQDEDKLIQDLQQIALAIEKKAPLEPFPFLKRGAHVRIIRGPFQGIEGIVSNRRKKFRVVLNVGMLNRAVALEIDAELVRPI